MQTLPRRNQATCTGAFCPILWGHKFSSTLMLFRDPLYSLLPLMVSVQTGFSCAGMVLTTSHDSMSHVLIL